MDYFTHSHNKVNLFLSFVIMKKAHEYNYYDIIIHVSRQFHVSRNHPKITDQRCQIIEKGLYL